jgi:hypothetical protein
MDSLEQFATFRLLTKHTRWDKVVIMDIKITQKENSFGGSHICLSSANIALINAPQLYKKTLPHNDCYGTTQQLKGKNETCNDCEIIRITLEQQALDVMKTFVISTT